MIPFSCPVCGLFDDQGISGHATNRCEPATNDATNTNAQEKPVPVSGPDKKAPAQLVQKSANRRSREDYNAYQREYMRKRRAA